MSQDRSGGDVVPLTQEFLAHMLGTRRASVTVAAGILQKAGLITYTRGAVTTAATWKTHRANATKYWLTIAELEKRVAIKLVRCDTKAGSGSVPTSAILKPNIHFSPPAGVNHEHRRFQISG